MSGKKHYVVSATGKIWRFFKRYLIAFHRCNDIRCDMPESTRFGSHYAIGTVIAENVEFGENCLIRQGLTIGQRHGKCDVKIGDNVEFGANATVLGEVEIGNNAKIAAGSVVLDDVPQNSTVAGVPAAVKNREEASEDGL